MTADSSDNTATLICRWLLVIALCVALVVSARWRHMERRALAGEDQGAAPAQQLLAIDVGGDLLVYGSTLSTIPGLGTSSPAAYEQSRAYAEAVSSPPGALRLAAMDAYGGHTERAAARLDGVRDDKRAAVLAAGLRAEPGSPELSEALDVASALQPLWLRRAYRVALATHAGDQPLLAREQGLIALEAGPRLTRILCLFGLLVFALIAGFPALLAALGYAVYKAATKGGPLVASQSPSCTEPAQAGTEGEQPRVRPWALIDALEIVVTFFAARGAMAIAFEVIGRYLSPGVLAAVGYLLPALCAAGVARWRIGPSFIRLLGFSGYPAWRSWLLAWWAALSLPLAVLGLTLLQSALMRRPPMSENPIISVVVGSRGWGERALLMALVAVVAPLVEEGLFRGALYAPIRRFAGPVGAIAITSLLFGAVHVDLAMLPQLALVGAACAVLREGTGSLKASIMLHGIWNAGQVAVMLLLVS